MIDTPTVSALTALAAVIIGPLASIYVTKYVTKRQIHASVVSLNRQKWIDSLRDQLANLITDLRLLGLHRGINLIAKEEYEERLQRILLSEIKINLFLNSNEADHKSLSDTIRSVIETIFGGNEIEKRRVASELLPVIVQQSQSILKREWQSVKDGA